MKGWDALAGYEQLPFKNTIFFILDFMEASIILFWIRIFSDKKSYCLEEFALIPPLMLRNLL